jgi:outer membrane protein assembly factor BamB
MKRSYLAGLQNPQSAMRTATVVGAAGLAAALSLAAPSAQAAPFDVTTYHYNSPRTGWNDSETVLKTANVNNTDFGWLFSVPLDDQVDAQPLLVAGQAIAGKGTHDVVYVATESNTIYAIDAASGTVLLTRKLGPPVLQTQLPGGAACNNSGPNIGINSTPVIDLAGKTMYVIAYTRDPFGYYVHALDLSNLTDRVPAKEVSASHKLSNGTTFDFNAHYQRQRPALVESKGNIYAGFGSFCDFKSNVSRGWLLGWKAGTLAPVTAKQLNDRVATSSSNFFLSSIWMSGYGVAADANGDLFFATGNSDTGAANTYNPPDNIQESVVKMSSDLATIVDYFTPGATPYDYHQRDINDEDLGAGGVMLLPDQPGSFHHLAAAAGKHGPVYLINRDNMGKHVSGTDKVVATATAGVCWCGPSYFRGSDGVGRLVTSGDETVMVWKVQTAPTTALVHESTSAAIPSGAHDPGFFTSVSSNGTTAGTAIIWAVSRPATNPGDLVLFAFNAQNGATLYNHAAGTWKDFNANPNVVPVVANGRVYVASTKELAVFGLHGTTRRAPQIVAEAAAPPAPAQPNQVFGVVTKVDGSAITLRTRTGSEVRVDSTAADKENLSVATPVGRALQVVGTTDSAGVMHAQVIMRVKDAPTFWEADR